MDTSANMGNRSETRTSTEVATFQTIVQHKVLQ